MTRIEGAAMLLAVAAAMGAVASAPSAQRLGRAHYEDSEHGYRFRFPDGWAAVPPQPLERELGVTCKMKGGPKVLTVSGKTYRTSPELIVLRFEEIEPEADPGVDRAEELPRRRTVEDALPLFFGDYRDLDIDDPVEVDDFKARGRLVGHRRRWIASNGVFDVVIDTYTYALEDADICLVFAVPDEYARKFLRVFEQVGRSMEPMERSGGIELERGGTYADVLRYHEGVTARTPGWRVVPTPSEQFVIKTSSDDDDFIEEVIERLEASRELFEADFPPEDPIEEVSVVRICSSADEFRAYSGAGRGTAGLFNPASIELILYDNKDIDRNTTYAVMTHEAFHQYCHFLFGESEAHRWFDEGHGDYYGGAEFERGRAHITPRMPGGLNRLDHAKELVRTGEYVRLVRHLHYDHGEWQNQGPKNVSPYCQSWSIVYFLRRGMDGEVSRKIWLEGYDDILPNYVRTLHAGFRAAYAEILEEREREARAQGRELEGDERRITRRDLDPDRRDAIWEAAMDASWGRIDLDRFEKNWITYVEKHL